MTHRTEILSLIADPTNAYVALVAGGILIVSEFLRPGRILPGVGGAVLLTMALHSLSQWPWSGYGLTLLIASFLSAISGLMTKSYISHLLCAVFWAAGSVGLVSAGNGIHPAAALAGGSLAFSISWLLDVGYRGRVSKRAIVSHR
jgi:membrane-bound serine protease (ClpP class)